MTTEKIVASGRPKWVKWTLRVVGLLILIYGSLWATKWYVYDYQHSLVHISAAFPPRDGKFITDDNWADFPADSRKNLVQQCPNAQDIVIGIYNGSIRTITGLSFKLKITRKGHSRYFGGIGNHFWTDLILVPGEYKEYCSALEGIEKLPPLDTLEAESYDMGWSVKPYW
jgi:hypothetical protein